MCQFYTSFGSLKINLLINIGFYDIVVANTLLRSNRSYICKYNKQNLHIKD